MADEPISALPLFTSYSTADEVEILDVSDTTFASTGTNKRIQFSTLLTMAGVGTTATGDVTLAPGSSTQNVIQPTGDYIALALEASASQTHHLQEWQNSSGTALAYVDSKGNINTPTVTATTGNISKINFGTQGGGISSPATTTLLTFQPSDPAKGSWQIMVMDQLFGSTHDSICYLGYNLSGGPAGEPTWHYGQEQDYYVAANGTHTCEAYQEFSTSSLHTRPWHCTLNRATGAVTIMHDLGPPGDPNYGMFEIVSNASATPAQLMSVSGGGTSASILGISQGTVQKAVLAAYSTYATATIGIGVDGYLVLGDSTHAAQVTFSNAFQFYKSAGDAHLYLSDLVHSRNMLIITPAVGTSTFAFGGNATITGGADTVQLTVTGNSTQTNNLQNWCNGSGAALSYVDVNGRFCCQVTSGPNAMAAYNAGTTGTVSGLLAQAWGTNSSGTNIGLNAVAQSAKNNYAVLATCSTGAGDYAVYSSGKAIVLGNANFVQFAVRGVGSQTADIQQWQPTSSTAVSRINSVGQFSGPQAGPLASKSGAYTVVGTERILLVSAASAGWALTLPAASTMTAGYEIYVKKTDNNSNAITITPNGSDKIDGASSYVLNAQYMYVQLMCDASANWYIMSAGTA
jgi:hypothetical protein